MPRDCADVAATLHAHLCEHDWHGYTQGSGRWGDGEGYCDVETSGGVFQVAQGDRDCSSSVIDAWRVALQGTPHEGCLDGATYTGNMLDVFTASGLFEWHGMDFIAQRGDIYLNIESHTAMCQSADPDELSEFCINENGGITGGEVGDQTGGESHIRDYYDFPWDGILHYNGDADDWDGGSEPVDNPHQEAGDPVNAQNLVYEAHVQDVGWCGPVRDGQCAGTTGYGKRLEAIRFDTSNMNVPGTLRIGFRLHIQDVGWKDFGEATVGKVVGTVGKALRIEAIEPYIIENGTGLSLKFRVHSQDVGWQEWQTADAKGYSEGSTGEARRIEAVGFVLE